MRRLPAREIWRGPAGSNAAVSAFVLAALFAGGFARAESPRPRVVVSGGRVAGYDPTGSVRLTPFELRSSPRFRLDDALRAAPGFSLFRRSGSLQAQPAAQGVSLRNIAPSGSGRSLVLLDGVPQNDPFGGWVYWSRLPSRDAAFVELSPGARPGPFGASAMAGTVVIRREEPPATPGLHGAAHFSAGGRGALDAEALVSLSERGGRGWIEARAARFQTDGYPLVAERFRGPVDIPAWSDARALDLRLSRPLEGGLRFGAGLGFFEEERGNGTPLTGSAARGADIVLRLEQPGAEGEPPEWKLLAFAQTRRFESAFSAVAPSRAFETPSLDQFNVPASALGLAFEAAPDVSEAVRLSWGMDARVIEGETNERFRRMEGRFTALREAGGRQILSGASARAAFATGALSHEIGLRGDCWLNDRSRRIERPLGAPSGFAARDRSAPDASGVIPSVRYDAAWQAAEPLTLSASAYLGGRVPALNELHRPFRVRDDVTESNPQLGPEQLRGIEAGAEARPGGGWKLSSRLFYNELSDGVANVTLGRGPFDSAVFGFVPPGVTLRQKRNLPRIDIAGAESAAEWAFAPGARLTARHLFTDSRVADAGPFTALEGRRPAQSPAHQFHAALVFTPAAGWEVALQGRGASFQYDDDLNRRKLADFTAADIRVAWSPRPGAEIFAACENLFDTEIETGRTDSGVVAVSGQRLFRAGFSLLF